jgi:hypothetical protein
MRRLLELVPQDRAFFVLGLPADEARPRPQERLVDDLDAVGRPGRRCLGWGIGEIVGAVPSKAALGVSHLIGRQEPSVDEGIQHLARGPLVRNDAQELVTVRRRPRRLGRH